MTDPKSDEGGAEMSPSHPPVELLSDELIAAFLEGALDAGRRDDLARRIAEDSEARSVLMEAVRFLEEEPDLAAESELPLASPVERADVRPARHPGWRIAIWGTQVAATVGLALSPLLGPGGPPGSFDADWYVLVVSAGADAQDLPSLLHGNEANVLGFVRADSPQARSFRAGVAGLDLEISLRSGADGIGASSELLARLRDLADASRERALSLALEQAVSHPGPASLGGLNRALVSSVPDRFHYELGRWVEASRLAAATGNRGFFRNPAFLKALGRARVGPLLEESRAGLEGATSALEAERPDLKILEHAFEQLILLY